MNKFNLVPYSGKKSIDSKILLKMHPKTKSALLGVKRFVEAANITLPTEKKEVKVLKDPYYGELYTITF